MSFKDLDRQKDKRTGRKTDLPTHLPYVLTAGLAALPTSNYQRKQILASLSPNKKKHNPAPMSEEANLKARSLAVVVMEPQAQHAFSHQAKLIPHTPTMARKLGTMMPMLSKRILQ